MSNVEMGNEGLLVIGGLSLVAYGVAGPIAAGCLMTAGGASFMAGEIFR